MPRYGELIFCGMVMLFVCGFLSYLFLRSYPEIDLEKGVFYPYGKKKRIFGKTPVVLPLKNVSAIELSHHSSCFSKHHFECFTLQLIVPRGQRNYHYMLLNHGDYSTFMMDAEKLSKALDLPLPDAGLEDFNNKRIRKFAPLALLIYPVIFFIIAKEISCAIQQKDMFLFICGVLIMPVMVFSLINTVKAFKGKN